MLNNAKNTELNKALGEHIGKLRVQKGLSQEELGKALGESREVIQHWERGSRQIKAAHLVKLADFFEVSVDHLLDEDRPNTRNASCAAACEYTGLSHTAAEHLHRIKYKAAYINTVNELIEDEDLFTPLAQYFWLFALRQFRSSKYRKVPLNLRTRFHQDVYFAAIIRALPLLANKIETKYKDDEKLINSLILDFCANHIDKRTALEEIGELDDTYEPSEATCEDWESYNDLTEEYYERYRQMAEEFENEEQVKLDAINEVLEHLSKYEERANGKTRSE